MNKKGMTLVELITTFALTAVIVVLLINVIVVIKNVYSKSSIKSELYINQSNLSNALNSKINNDNLDYYEECVIDNSLLCVDFNFINGESIRLSVSEKEIKFGEYIYKLDNNTKVMNPSINVEYINLEENGNNIMTLRIPIQSTFYPNIDFGINLVYLYNIN